MQSCLSVRVTTHWPGGPGDVASPRLSQRRSLGISFAFPTGHRLNIAPRSLPPSRHHRKTPVFGATCGAHPRSPGQPFCSRVPRAHVRVIPHVLGSSRRSRQLALYRSDPSDSVPSKRTTGGRGLTCRCSRLALARQSAGVPAAGAFAPAAERRSLGGGTIGLLSHTHLRPESRP